MECIYYYPIFGDISFNIQYSFHYVKGKLITKFSTQWGNIEVNGTTLSIEDAIVLIKTCSETKLRKIQTTVNNSFMSWSNPH